MLGRLHGHHPSHFCGWGLTIYFTNFMGVAPWALTQRYRTSTPPSARQRGTQTNFHAFRPLLALWYRWRAIMCQLCRQGLRLRATRRHMLIFIFIRWKIPLRRRKHHSHGAIRQNVAQCCQSRHTTAHCFHARRHTRFLHSNVVLKSIVYGQIDKAPGKIWLFGYITPDVHWKQLGVEEFARNRQVSMASRRLFSCSEY